MNWLPFATEFDNQNGLYVVTEGCESYGQIDQLEAQLNYQLANNHITGEFLSFLQTAGYITNGKVKLSERYLVVLSNTTLEGNTDAHVMAALLLYGLVPDSVYPFPSQQRIPPFDRTAYFTPPSAQIIALGQRFLDFVEIDHKEADKSVAGLKAALDEAPVKITIGIGTDYYNPNVIVPRTENAETHCVVITSIDEAAINIQDSLPPFTKRLALTYNLFSAFVTTIKQKSNHMIDVVNENGTYFLVGEKGKFGLADSASLAKVKEITDKERPPVASDNVPQMGIIEQGFTIHK